jgi:hypothetical protein
MSTPPTSEDIIADTCRPRQVCTYLAPHEPCEGPPKWLVRFTCNSGHEFVGLTCGGHFRAMASGEGPPHICGSDCDSNQIAIISFPLERQDA